MVPKPWHTPDHAPQRIEMNKRIVNLLQQRRPDASNEWCNKLPQMAKRLEEALYSEAESFDFYNNYNTLKGRLQQLAMSMSKGSRQGPHSGGAVGQDAGQQNLNNQQQFAKMPMQQQQGTSFQQIQQQQQMRQNYPSNGSGSQRPPTQGISQSHGQYQQVNGTQPITIATENTGTVSGDVQPGMSGMASGPGGNHYPNTNNVNPPVYPNTSVPKNMQSAVTTNAKERAKEAKMKKEAKGKTPVAASKGVESKSLKKGTKRAAGGTDEEPVAKMPKTKKLTKKEQAEEAKRLAILEKGNQAALAAAKSKNAKSAGNSQSGGHTEDHRRAVLKQQIQRLLLLRHASKCPHEADRCPVTAHCASMKQLWKHLMKCKDQECKVAHCVSSRYVLSHYSKCQDTHCPVCGPVRASIRKASNENSEIVNSFNKKGEASSVGAQKPVESNKPQPPDSLSSAIYNFTDEQIKYHMTHLHDGLRMKAADVRHHCMPLVDEMIRHPNGYIFASPVDPVKLMIPDYPEIIKRPMDLGTIRKRLETNYYRDLGECANDIRLTFDNAMLYNPMSSDVHRCARHFKLNFEKNYKGKLELIEKETEVKRTDPDSCRLCGEKDMYFELPNYYCNGKCASRIKRNAVFYSDEKNTLHWCQSCYNDLRDPIKVVGSANLCKKDLKKAKLMGDTEELREPMVCCDGCERWVHYVCGLFNGRRNLSKEMQYFCPSCVLQQRAKKPPQTIVPEKKMLASTLPHCLLSEFIEQRVAVALEKAYEENAKKLNSDVSSIEKAPTISIRQVSCIDNNQPTQEGMRKRFAHKNYPAEFPCRAKCLLMFQNIDGQDVILFGMYVYEYGHNCPQPNQRRVYISYLDSVHYLRPRQYRTTVYHEILIAYLEYVKRRGFHTAHIWACPPMPKDDYIFNIHPPDQKTPKQERLRQWYVTMLDTCVQRGIVEEVNDLHTEFMLDENNDATVLPYLDGDYWVGLAEDIIKKLGTEGQICDEGSSNLSDKKSKRKKDKKSLTKRNRGRQPRGTTVSNPTFAIAPGRDPVMAKLAATIEPMKLDFFVARLHSKEYIASCARMAKEEQDEESRRFSDKESDERKLQEEALSSGDSNGDVGKMGKMRKGNSTSSTSSNNDSSSSGENSSGSSEMSTVSDSLKSSSLPPTDQLAQTNLTADGTIMHKSVENSEKMDVEEIGTQATTEVAPNNVGAGQFSTTEVEKGDAMEIDNAEMKERTDSGEEKSAPHEGGLLASVSKFASTIFGNNGNGGDEVQTKGEGKGPLVDTSAMKMEVDEELQNVSDKISVPLSNSESVQEQSVCEEKESMEKNGDGVESKMEVEECRSEIDGKKDPSESPPSTTENMKEDDRSVVTSATNAVVRKAVEIKEEVKVDISTPTKDTEDRDDTQECEHFETRLAFLQLCQGNHYQFDQLRRAKHTSMMVLYHLHNPDAPKFMAVCNVPTCNQSIVHGTRFHCETCDIDYCQSCYVNQRHTKTAHIHPLRPIAVSGSSSVQPLTDEQRRERNRSIQLHLQLLLHSARDCIGKKCTSKNCEKMKEFLKHEPNCKVGTKKGCPTCKKVLNLLTLHARNCRVENCPVPKCVEIKEKIRQQQLKQRQMDERRRHMMNEMYRSHGN